jgi:hypothetical protein
LFRAQSPKKVLDCTANPFLANSSATCDRQQASIQACIAAAAKQGASTMAYLPASEYKICKPLTVPAGDDFFFRGNTSDFAT